ncbi:sensor histidine kinase [Lysinibacillus sp. LZ02]|uniref:sensor histidine kinase n=1 Tax=Lysinibacillus sp. LZ02 TaxID=3420668 RepID=UPI003D36746F
MEMEWIPFIVLNFFIVFGSLFYLLNIRPTVKRIFACLMLNALVAIIAIQFSHIPWLSLTLSMLFSGSLFYFITKKSIVFLHLMLVHLMTMLIEYFALLLVHQFELPFIIHGLLIVLMFTVSLYGYKQFIHNTLKQLAFSSQVPRLLLVISIITFIVFYVTVFAPSNNGEITISLVNLGMLCAYFLFLLISSQSIIQTMRKEALWQQKEVEQRYFHEYMEGLEEMNRKVQRVQHDYSNLLLSMHGYMEQEDWNGLKDHFETNVLPTTQQPFNYFQQLEHIKIIELKGLIGAKLLKANNLHITVQIEVPEEIKSIPLNVMDLIRIMGIFLDNAIEASLQHINPKIQIAFLYSNQHELIIIIRNTTSQHYMDMKQLFDENYSTKGENRGLGLYNVKQLLAGYPTTVLNTYIEADCFIQEMVIEREVSSNESCHL